MISAHVSRTSAAVLLLGGLALLFGADEVLPRVVPGFPVAGAWIGQLLGAAWLAVAALNWLGRAALLGGIYGRPVVMANAMLYFGTTMSLVRLVARRDAPVALWLLFVPMALFAGAYAWLLFRGPLERDIAQARR